MTRMFRFALPFALAAAGFWPTTAPAEELRDFCADRPGLGTPACTIDRGHVALELGIGDWTLDRQDGSRSDTIVTGDLLLRYGLTDTLEAQIGWTALGFARDRDAAGSVGETSGAGDVRIALRQNLHNPDGSGFSAAIMPYLTLPTGGGAIGDGDWTAGLIVPLSYEYPGDVQIALTGEVGTVPDEQGDGHHLTYAGVIGLGLPLGTELGATLELAAERDEEQGMRRTTLLGGVSLAWMRGASFQIDAGANVGLNRDSADIQAYVGIAKRF